MTTIDLSAAFQFISSKTEKSHPLTCEKLLGSEETH